MKGWQIFVHALRMVFGNLEGALRVSGVLYVAQLAIGLLFLPEFLKLSQPGGQELFRQQFMDGNVPWFRAVLMVLIAVICSLWTAVAWHRYVLVDEKPGFLPPFRGDRILGYFLRGLLVGVIMIPVVIVIGLIGGALAAISGGNMTVLAIFAILITLPTWVIGLRLSASLPGAALGDGDGGIGGAWSATAGDWGSFIVLAIILAVASTAAAYIGERIFTGVLLGMLWSVVYGWVQLMVGISLLTTLYGHYVEKRPLV